MPCPYLEFTAAANGHGFERERPFCAAAESFVEPMRADVCAERFGLAPAAHCEIYRFHEGLGE